MIEEIREIDKNIPIIIQSAESESKNLLKAIKHKIHHFIAEPMNKEILLENIQDACKNLLEEKLIEKQKKEIENYIDIIDQVAIISKTDKR